MSLQKQTTGRERFLRTAEKLFTQYGYEAVSIRDIANALGVTNAAIYYHFDSKEALFEEVIINHVDDFRHRMIEAAERYDDEKEKLVEMLMVYKEVASHRHSLFALLHMKKRIDTAGDAPGHIKGLMRTFFEPVEETIDRAIAKGTLRQLPPNILGSAILIGMIHGTMQQFAEFQQQAPDRELIANVVDIFWNGMINRSEVHS